MTVPALEGNNSAAYDLKELNDNVQRVMLGPHINYNEEEKTINAMVGAVRQLMSDPESQLMAAVAIGIGTLNNRLFWLLSTPARRKKEKKNVEINGEKPIFIFTGRILLLFCSVMYVSVRLAHLRV